MRLYAHCRRVKIGILGITFKRFLLYAVNRIFFFIFVRKFVQILNSEISNLQDYYFFVINRE